VWSLRGTYRSFQALTESALDYALAVHGVESNALKARLLSAYRQLDAFPEVVAALTALRARRLRLAPPCPTAIRICWKRDCRRPGLPRRTRRRSFGRIASHL
jgi:hypothetical protein